MLWCGTLRSSVLTNFFFIFSSKSWWLCLVVGFLCSCIVFTPVFLHSFLLHKTILYYFLVFFFFFLILLLVALSLLLIYFACSNFAHLTNNHLSHIFFYFCNVCIIIIDLRALFRSLFLLLSRIVILSSALSIYICFHLFSCVVFVFPLTNVFFFLVCFWF